MTAVWTWCWWLVVALVAGGGAATAAPAFQQPSGAGTQPGTSRYKLLRTVSGTKGTIANGRFSIDDPRTVFYVPDDKQLVFYFEWEGPPGTHRLEGVWIDPKGMVATVSAFDYQATEKRFGARWTMPVSPGIAVGTWSFEVRVDGEAAGRHPFQLVEGEKPANLAVARRALSAAEAYRRLQSSAVVLEALDDSAAVVGTALGFAVARDHVVTAFEAVDGASAVRVRFPDGRAAEVRDVAAYERWQNWVVLPIATGSLPLLTPAAAREWQVGDHVISLNLGPDASVTLVDAAIKGTARPDRVGERLTLASEGPARSPGAPVINEYGDLIGMVADQTVPGASTLPRPMFGPSATESLAAKPGIYAVPVEVIQLSGDRALALSFAQLVKDGVFTPLLGPGKEHVARATTARGLKKESNWLNPLDETAVFLRTGGPIAVVLNLRPRGKMRVLANCQVLDLEGRKLAEGKAATIKAGVNDTPSFAWSIPVASTLPGLYRLEIVFDGVPVWRTFVRVTGR